LSVARHLTPEAGWIFRITHRDNVPWILDHGLHCSTSLTRDPDFVTIGNQELIDKRSERIVPTPPGGRLGDYIPFYITPFSPMFFKIHTGHGGIQRRSNTEIVILRSSLDLLGIHAVRFLISDRHAFPRGRPFLE